MKLISLIAAFVVLLAAQEPKQLFNQALELESSLVETQKEKAIEFYTKAAKQKLKEAQFNLANIYAKRANTTEDIGYVKAQYWYNEAIKQNCTRALTNLAALKLRFSKSPKTIAEVKVLLDRAKSAKATLNLAIVYGWYDKSENAKAKAMELFERLLKKGEDSALAYKMKLCSQNPTLCKSSK